MKLAEVQEVVQLCIKPIIKRCVDRDIENKETGKMPRTNATAKIPYHSSCLRLTKSLICIDKVLKMRNTPHLRSINEFLFILLVLFL